MKREGDDLSSEVRVFLDRGLVASFGSFGYQ
jgi:hypothetical protein